ncbi:MAG: Protease 4 [Pseudidiomarina mangrovi]|nr:MAG: Protease 4 [Pseudidiomarina mangrovi]
MSAIANVFGKLFGLLNSIRKIILNVIFFVVLAALVVLIFAEDEPIVVPENGMLVLNLRGSLVEQKTYVDPIDEFFDGAFGGSGTPPETLLSEVLESIELATNDARISGIYLDLRGFSGAGLNKLQLVAEALTKFRQSGKPVRTYADFYSQPQYYLAAHADFIGMNPLGGMMFEGFGGYRLYYKDLLEKLKISTHVFKAGDFKSAVEPYIRNDMSEQARLANKELYDALWVAYLNGLTNQRDLDARVLSGSMDDFRAAMSEYNNDMAQFALQSGLVDELLTREAFRQQQIALTGLDEESDTWKQINHNSYLQAQQQDNVEIEQGDSAEIALVVARGVIMDGRQRAGSIGGDSTAALLRKARLNENTKAVVLRIDSPGGSGFASEVIRQEVLELQKAGIPVIASMSSVAASGGYWIAASADEIWASPNTITGSIGVFSMFFTGERALAEIGVYNDGYHTTELPIIDVTRGLTDEARDVIQLSINKFYRDFVSMVADSRGMTYDAVHAVAQGRVWTGAKAQELGLVDQLGELDDAISAAAQRAEISDYQVVVVEEELSAREQFLHSMFGGAQVLLPDSMLTPSISPIEQELRHVWQQLSVLQQFNDPRGSYALCELCPTD